MSYIAVNSTRVTANAHLRVPPPKANSVPNDGTTQRSQLLRLTCTPWNEPESESESDPCLVENPTGLLGRAHVTGRKDEGVLGEWRPGLRPNLPAPLDLHRVSAQ
jgi:hypothetical protein